MIRLVFVTGRPGVGKTTVLLNVVRELKNRGYKISGMLTREVRQNGTRVGFEIEDLATGRKGWLAHVNQPQGPQVGKYRVNLNDTEQIGVNAVQNAVRESEVVVIDEIGPMELFSEAFQQAVNTAIKSNKLVLGVMHRNARNPLIDLIKKREDAEIFEVTTENRRQLHNILIENATQFLEGVHRGL